MGVGVLGSASKGESSSEDSTENTVLLMGLDEPACMVKAVEQPAFRGTRGIYLLPVSTLPSSLRPPLGRIPPSHSVPQVTEHQHEH